MIKLTVVLCFCSSVVFAETTVEMIQKRAEAGDAEAQTLMGMMAFYGCQIPRDREASQKWYQRAADQGDSFAAGRIKIAKSKLEGSNTDSSDQTSSSESPSKTRSSKQRSPEEKVADASFAEYKGNVKLEELVRNRAEYVGKVVELKVVSGNFFPSSDHASMFVYDSRNNFSGVHQILIVSGQQALEWAVKQSKRGFGASCKVYALVEDERLIPLGTNQSQADKGYTYSW